MGSEHQAQGARRQQRAIPPGLAGSKGLWLAGCNCHDANLISFIQEGIVLNGAILSLRWDTPTFICLSSSNFPIKVSPWSSWKQPAPSPPQEDSLEAGGESGFPDTEPTPQSSLGGGRG